MIHTTIGRCDPSPRRSRWTAVLLLSAVLLAAALATSAASASAQTPEDLGADIPLEELAAALANAPRPQYLTLGSSLNARVAERGDGITAREPAGPGPPPWRSADKTAASSGPPLPQPRPRPRRPLRSPAPASRPDSPSAAPPPSPPVQVCFVPQPRDRRRAVSTHHLSFHGTRPRIGAPPSVRGRKPGTQAGSGVRAADSEAGRRQLIRVSGWRSSAAAPPGSSPRSSARVWHRRHRLRTERPDRRAPRLCCPDRALLAPPSDAVLPCPHFVTGGSPRGNARPGPVGGSP